MYDRDVIDKTILKIDETKQDGKITEMVFGFYLRFLFAKNPDNSDLTFEELETIVPETTNKIDSKISNPKTLELQKRWGKNFSEEDYEFLEEEYSAWSEDRKTLTAPDRTLLEEICHLKLQIKRTRNPDNPADDLVKQLQGLVKSANEQLKVNKNQEEDGVDTLSGIIKIIETEDPADYYKNKSLYADFDYDLKEYHDKHVTRPIINFATGQRDFDFEMNSEKEQDEDMFDVEGIPEKEDDETGG